MSRLTLLAALIAVPLLCPADDEFRRPLPDPKLLDQITGEKFVNQDAVVILKEQGFALLNTEYTYRGVDIEGLSTFHTKVVIAKMLTQKGVARYGTFTCRYYEWFGDEIPNRFKIAARVRKADGSVEVVSSPDMEPKVSRRDSDGDILEREVVFKIPNLAVGDVLQIEHEIKETFTVSRSEVFFYDEPDYVIYSNLFITLPSEAEAQYISIPEDRIGKPQVVQLQQSYGAGETHFWSVRNLPPLTREPYAPPFEERALLTSFVVQRFGINGVPIGDWSSLGERFYRWSLKGDNVSSGAVAALGVRAPSDPGTVTKASIDSLYAALRRAVRVTPTSVLYPLSSDIESIFEEKKGDASDLSYAMYRILTNWNIPSSIVLIRDRRAGIYEQSIPTLSWFDRLGVSVRVEGKEHLYDFDVTVPIRYEVPWHLKGVMLPVVTENRIDHRVLVPLSSEKIDNVEEQHFLSGIANGRVQDSVAFCLEGSEAAAFRMDHYTAGGTMLEDVVREFARGSIRKSVSVSHNDFIEEPAVRMSVKGEYSGRVDSVSGLRSIALVSSSLQRLRDRVYSEQRLSDIMLPTPMTIRLRWEFQLPKEYMIEKGDQIRTIRGPRGALFQMTPEQAGETMVIRGHLSLPEKNFRREDHKPLVGFLDESLKAVGTEIVMKKK